MNFEGRVSSVNTILWTFQLDNTIIVHTSCLAAYDTKQRLPEVGEFVHLYNVHYKVNKLYQLQKLFLCQRSRIVCNHYKDHVREDKLLQIIRDFNLGASDLLEIDYNIDVIDNFIKKLAQEPSESIILKVIHCLITNGDQNIRSYNVHKCLNKNIPLFTLITISNCQYVDLHNTAKVGPPWNLGVHRKKNKRDILIGCLHVNKHGIVCLRDAKYNMSCIITSRKDSLKRRNILNKFVLIKNYYIFTETYRESGAVNLEYILFDIADALVLDIKLDIRCHSNLVTKVPNNVPYLYDFQFKLLNKATINITKELILECWLEVLFTKSMEYALIGLNAYQIQIVPYLEEGKTYRVFHSKQMKVCKYVELSRLKKHSVLQKFDEKNVLFVQEDMNSSDKIVKPVLNVVEALERLKESTDLISFQGLLCVKKFTPALTSRTENKVNCVGFGTPGTQTHTLIFTDDTRECNLLLYLNNWENLQIPLGLVLDMRICVKNVLPQKGKYLKSCAMTTFEVLNYEPLVAFNTVNLKAEQTYGCDQYSFLGLGDLIPCNVLIWAKIVQLSIRSLKNNVLYAYDEMGQSVVISKSTELLRLLLGLEPRQWVIWSQAFENIGEYVHDFNDAPLPSLGSDINNTFYMALAVSIQVINATRISDLELKCRKMESSSMDNEGMPKWFCVDARRRTEYIF
ncbi:hypothetical protein ILUMI_22818 [Ignelater luminosus]|uniref:Uncharacterized protein n=1 Tax=Ignelater luminosus TaxID=2038154 RepID=A0A8K0CDM2_IGNLU|nr:hypothetical protein ILUMI_22818 [Ignelater luminosus]